jgi:hypothetical protein
VPVKDDWDDDDDSADEQEDSRKLWEDACVHFQSGIESDLHNLIYRNSKSPMPQVVTSSGPTAVPPAGVFQGPIKILKRSTSPKSSDTTRTSQNDGSADSYAEREARYQAARNRIFADGDKKATEKEIATVLRQPLGPSDQAQQISKGFGKRRAKDAQAVVGSSETDGAQ